MTLSLPDVTLVMVDAIAHDLAHEALRDTLRQIEPGAVHVWSDQRILPSAESHYSEILSLDDYNHVMWYEVPKYIRTSHFLTIQYDGWVLDADRWNEEWLKYDYIGAPWGWHRDLNVGNGGFSLRSADLAKFLANGTKQFPVATPEDDILCRRYRPELEHDGFYWATDVEASWFAFERTGVPHSTFGFHGIFNWARVLSRDALQHRIALANSYVKSRSEWRELIELTNLLEGVN